MNHLIERIERKKPAKISSLFTKKISSKCLCFREILFNFTITTNNDYVHNNHSYLFSLYIYAAGGLPLQWEHYSWLFNVYASGFSFLSLSHFKTTTI